MEQSPSESNSFSASQ